MTPRIYCSDCGQYWYEGQTPLCSHMNREVSLEAEAPEKDAFELIIERITEDALKTVTTEEMARVLTGQGALTIRTDGDGVVMRYVEPWERGDEAASPAEANDEGPGIDPK